MDDASSGAGQMASSAMGRASGMYNEAVSQAGPGMAANASVLLALLVSVSALISFLDADGTFKLKFYDSFNGLGVVGLIVVSGILITRVVSGNIMPLNKKTVLSLLGIIGMVVGVVLVISTLIGLSIDRGGLGGLGGNKFGTFLADAGWAVFVLVSGLWAMADSAKA